MSLIKSNLKIFFTTFFVLSLCCGCFSEQKESSKSHTQTDFAAYYQPHLPFAATAEEAVQQLQEGNARFVHRELRMQELPATNTENKTQPFAAIIKVCTMAQPLHLIFDQPEGTLLYNHINHTTTNKEWQAALKQWRDHQSLRLIVVLREEGCATRQDASNLISAIRRFLSSLPQLSSFAVSEAVYHPHTHRVEFLSWQKAG